MDWDEHMRAARRTDITEEEFQEWLDKIPDEVFEPFCPFCGAYCDTAFSLACVKCAWRIKDETLL